MIKHRKIIRKNIEDRLKKENEYFEMNERPCFKTASGGFLRLDTLGGSHDSIVIEYADNKREAGNNRFEDGDVFDIREYSEDELFTIVSNAIKEY